MHKKRTCAGARIFLFQINLLSRDIVRITSFFIPLKIKEVTLLLNPPVLVFFYSENKLLKINCYPVGTVTKFYLTNNKYGWDV
jgi:hypothetical protein